eukprot:gene17366-20667_t
MSDLVSIASETLKETQEHAKVLKELVNKQAPVQAHDPSGAIPQDKNIDTKTITLVTRICMENHSEGWYFQDTKDCGLLLLNEPNILKARTGSGGKAKRKEFHEKVNTAQRNNTRHMVAKKVKKVVPIIYREFFQTAAGKVESGTWLAQSYWEWVLEVEKHNLSTSALTPKSKVAWPMPATDIDELAALEEPFER